MDEPVVYRPIPHPVPLPQGEGTSFLAAMLIRTALAFLLLSASLAPALAQDAPEMPAADAPAAPAYELPFPTGTPEAHAVELALGGAGEGALAVHVASAPPWLRFETSEVAPSLASADGTEPVARLAFSVERVAPVGEPATVELAVTDAAGLERARHAVSVVVAPPALGLRAPVPNPSRGGAVVSFTASGAEAVRVSVVDMLGREVAVLAEGALAAGAHERRLPRLASGAYVVRLVGGEVALAERLTVVR